MVLSRKIQDLIADGRTEAAIDLLLDLQEKLGKELRNEIILLSGQYRQWKRNQLLGMEEREQTLNRIQVAVLDLSERLPKNIEERQHPIPWHEMQPFFVEGFDMIEAVTNVDTDQYYSQWLPEKDEVWESSLEDGNYILANQVDPAAIRYRWINVNDRDMAKVATSLEVKVVPGAEASPVTGAGLLYCFNQKTGYYYIFAIAAGQRYLFFRRDQNGLSSVFSGRFEGIRDGAFNKISLVREYPLFHLYVNDQYVRALREDSFQTGDSGIVAIGQGIFYFDNLSFYD